ncbi:hypothetical protein MF672_008175 [Actinomadura sp. ATCC 31491]|uniref:Uncharacterized protein n=1 Tax=Actinomadura luzonensis TaxID=2805427 RepID=A0ABT0FPD4_9ACTN|nr:hypothetical protein [Actinomadura luzonensis]MCK2213763.1 hypothetical protein [Actinomadura luzonensis]
MTRYAIDRARGALVAQWSIGIGETATTVADLPPALPRHELLRLSAGLTRLSHACWRCYTHPADVADHQGPGSLGWHRQQERDAFGTVLRLLTTAGRSVPPPAGTRVQEAAHTVGRALHVLGSPALTARITGDVAAELDAVERAELGDLSERAAQAVALSREDASPSQVSQADRLLRRHPFGCDALFTRLDPTAAAIAAAHWLHAAVVVTADLTRIHPAQIVAAADQHAKPLAFESLTEVVGVLGRGGRPRQVVMSLIRNALHVGEGHLRGIIDARHRINAAERLIGTVHAEHPELGIGADTVPLPLTPLDPGRPAPDLLENLLHGIQSCWRLYERYVALHQPRGGTVEGVRRQRLRRAFLIAVREEAGLRRDQLL